MSIKNVAKAYLKQTIPFPAQGLSPNAGTKVLLFHRGYPHNPAEAIHHLSCNFMENQFPGIIANSMANLYWKKYSVELSRCIDNAQLYSDFEETIVKASKDLEKILENLVPEFSPFSVYFSSSTENVVPSIISQGVDYLCMLPLYPLYNDHSRFAISRINKLLEKQTKTNEFCTGVDDVIDAERTSHISSEYPTSFICTRIFMYAMPQLAHYFAEKILTNLVDGDSVVFAVPLPNIQISKMYTDLVTTTCQRIMYALLERSQISVNWRVAFYKSWDQLPSAKRYPTINEQDDLILLQPSAEDKGLLHSIADIIKSELLTIHSMQNKNRKNDEFSNE